MAEIANAIQAYLIASNLKEESSRKEKRFYISDMGKCFRIRWIKRKGISTELTPYVYWIFKIGEMIHDFGYKALEAQSMLLSTEEFVEKEHWIGKYDGTIIPKKLPRMFDFKSAGQYAIKKAIAGADNEENIKQILTYVMVKLENGSKVDETGTLVYMNKEPNDLVPVIAYDREYHLTKVRRKELVEEMDQIVDYWVNDKIPLCTCSAWMRNYNSYLPFCLMGEKDIRKYLSLLKDSKRVISTKQAIYITDIGDDLRKEVFHL